MKYWKLVILTTALALSTGVNAAIITHGHLTTDDTTDYITDTSTGRMYMRFDTFNLSVADTSMATIAGGVYEGWSIADSVVADEFYGSILGASSTPCTGADNNNTLCGVAAVWNEGDFGGSYNDSADLFWFYSTYATPNMPTQAIGVGAVAADGRVYDFDDHWTTGVTDEWNVLNPTYPINALLYRDTSVVPAPAAVWLFGSGLIGLIGFAKRKVS